MATRHCANLRCRAEFEPRKPWQRHCSIRCRKAVYESSTAGRERARLRALRYSHGPRRRLTRGIARLQRIMDYFVSELLDRDAAETSVHTNARRLTTQRDLRHVRWERLPLPFRAYAENARLADRRLLREWRKFWARQIAQLKAELRRLKRP